MDILIFTFLVVLILKALPAKKKRSSRNEPEWPKGKSRKSLSWMGDD